MKLSIISATAAFSICCATPVTAAVYYEDHFSYTTGQPLIGNSTANSWLKSGNVSQINNPVQVAGGSLADPSLPGITGNRVTLQLGTDNEKPKITYTLPGTTPPSVYASFLLKIDTSFDTGTATVAAFITGSNTNRAKVFIRGSATDPVNSFNVGLSYAGGSPTVTWDSREFPAGVPAFIVMAYDTNIGTNDDVSRIWINPARGGAEPAAHITKPNTGTDSELTPNTFVMRQEAPSAGQSGTFEIDELRVADTWSEVAPANAAIEDWMIYNP